MLSIFFLLWIQMRVFSNLHRSMMADEMRERENSIYIIIWKSNIQIDSLGISAAADVT